MTFGWTIVAVVQTSTHGQELKAAIALALGPETGSRSPDESARGPEGRVGVKLSSQQRKALEQCTIRVIAIGADPEAAPPTALRGIDGVVALRDYLRNARPKVRGGAGLRVPVCKPMSFSTRHLRDGRYFRLDAEAVFQARRHRYAPFRWRASIASAHIVDNEDNGFVSSPGEWMTGLRYGDAIALRENRGVRNGARLTGLVTTQWFTSRQRFPEFEVRIGEQDHNRTRWEDFSRWEARRRFFPRVDAARSGCETLRVPAGRGVNTFELRIEAQEPQFKRPEVRGPGDLLDDGAGTEHRR